MKDPKIIFSWLTTPASRRFWLPRIGILIMILGIGLEVRFGLHEALFLLIEIVGAVVWFVGLVNSVRSFGSHQ